VRGRRSRPCASTSTSTGLVVTTTLLALIVATWSLGTARYGGPDEPAHVIRAASVAGGDVRGEPAAALAPGFRVVTVEAELATGDPICFRRDPTLPAACSVARPSSGTVRVGTAAGIYPPLYYAVVGAPVRVAGASESAGAHRIPAVALHVGVLALALVRARRFGRGGLLVAAVMPPSACFLLGVVNPTGVEIALCLLAWVGVAALAHDATARPHEGTGRPTAGAVAWVSLPAAAAIAIRPVALMPAVAVVLVSSVVATRWTLRTRAALLVPPAAAGCAVAAWNAWVALEFDDPRTAVTVGTWEALRRASAGTPDTLRDSVDALSWGELSAPWPAQVLWAFVAVACVAVVWRSRSPRLRVALALWSVVLVLGPVAFEVAVHERIGFIWQGRYSISTLVGLGALAAAAVVRSHRCDGSVSRATRALIPGLVVAAAIAEALAFWAVVRRYTVGTAGSWWLTNPTWDPVLEPRLLLAAHVVVVAGSAAALITASARVRGRTKPPEQ
jgi:hypothetical protein